MRPLRIWSACFLLLAGTLPAADEPAGTDAKVVEDQLYSVRDDVRLLADVYIPEGVGPFPMIVTIHSGSWLRGSRTRMKDSAVILQKAGFVVVNVEYSLAPRYRYPANLEDLREAVRWSRRNAASFRGDATFIAAYGYSSGGHLALLLGCNQSPDEEGRVQAVVAGGAPTDFFLMPEYPRFFKKVFGTSRTENPALYREVSPLFHVDRDTPPMFLYHGTDDWLIDIEHARLMTQRLREKGVVVELLEYARGHLTTDFWKEEALEPAVSFLRKQVERSLAHRMMKAEEAESRAQ